MLADFVLGLDVDLLPPKLMPNSLLPRREYSPKVAGRELSAFTAAFDDFRSGLTLYNTKFEKGVSTKRRNYKTTNL